jgi:hypothetical protein
VGCKGSCSTDDCGAAKAAAAGDSCAPLPDAVLADFDKCDLGTGPATP